MKPQLQVTSVVEGIILGRIIATKIFVVVFTLAGWLHNTVLSGLFVPVMAGFH